MNTNTQTVDPTTARRWANQAYGDARAELMEAQRQYQMNHDLAGAERLVEAHKFLDHASKVWSSPFPERHYN